MNQLLLNVGELVPLAIALLLQITTVLAIGLITQRLFTRSAVARHAVLLWSLTGVAVCLAVDVGLRIASLWQPALVKHLTPFPAYSSVVLVPVPTGMQDASTSIPALLLLLWLVGTFVGLARLISGLLAVRQLGRGGTYTPSERVDALWRRIQGDFGRKLPHVLLSDRVSVPVAAGFWRPVILLPPATVERLDERQLLQVLVHECAHALRGDALVGCFERALAAAFWFHPLVHLSNRLLDQAREEICDNHVLRFDGAREYSATLLTVAQAILPHRQERLAPSLYLSAWRLEDRVAGLLDSRRCLMIKLTRGKSAILACGFTAAALTLSCLAGSPDSQTKPAHDFSHVVQINKAFSQAGDIIGIDEVRGPSDRFVVGGTYEVKGTYKLISREKAILMANVTIREGERELHPNSDQGQTMVVSKGEGHFTLRFHMYQPGAPHVSFYPWGGGNDMFGIYL